MRKCSAIIGSFYFLIFATSAAFAEDGGSKIEAGQATEGFVAYSLPNVQKITYKLPVAGSAPQRLAIMDEAVEPLAAPDEDSVGPKDFEKIAEDTQVIVESRRYPEWEEIRTYEIAYQALNIVDAVQTVAALRSNKVREMNPILGSSPSTITVIGYKAAWGGAHYLLTRWIMREKPEFARIFQFASIALQGSTVAWNMTKVF
ncbi:MAG: hypothetical protein WA842_04000 [Croceibacterium sp.]